MKQIFICLISVLISLPVFSQENNPSLQAFAFYTSEGTETDYNTLLKSLGEANIVLFGEKHNNAIIHWIQLRLIKDMAANHKIVLGAEFFERDDQLKLDEYTAGLISARNFEAEARLWNNYKTDYKPMVDFARASNLQFIATNVPRRYAAVVAKSGLDTLRHLSKEAKAHMAKLPVKFTMETPGYTEMEEMMGGSHGMDMEKIIQAQAIKDATMAESILNHLKKGEIFIHINGDYHSANYGGIYWYLKQAKPKNAIRTIAVFEQENLGFTDEMKNSGDFILIVPHDSPKSY